MPASFTAQRYRDSNGRSVLTPFTGEYGDYREVGGIWVPFAVEAIRIVDGEPKPYARFDVERAEFDRTEPF